MLGGDVLARWIAITTDRMVHALPDFRSFMIALAIFLPSDIDRESVRQTQPE